MAKTHSVFAKILLVAGILLVALQNATALHSTDSITSAGDNTRSAYQDNHNLDPNVVKSGTFNVIWRKRLLGNYNGFNEQIYAQPLVFTPEGHEQYLYVVSQHNIVYRMDARTGEILAHRQLMIPFLTIPDLEGCNDISDCVGSTATGVIDPATNTWYLTTKTYVDQTRNTPQGLKAGRYFIHALDVITLESKPNFPIPLEGIAADNAPWRIFESGKHHQRPALMQVGSYVYAGFASHCVQWNFTGWVIGWHATEGRLVTKYAMEGGRETNGIGGGIWMSGGGLSSDNPGRMFFATGNGYASQLADDPVPGRQPPTALEEAVVNMAINDDGSLTPTDFFMPWEKRDLDGMDKDLGTSGFVLLQPDVFSTSRVSRIGTVAGKTGKLYFLDINNLGGYQMGPNRKDAVLQTIEMAGPVFSSAGAYPHEGGYVYVTPVGHQTVAFKFGQNANGDPIFTQAGVTAESAAGRQGVGHMAVTSMNGEPGTGILWICDVDGSNLRAYGTIPVDGQLPLYALLNNVAQTKFSRPVFGDGRVYLTTHTGYVTAFGSPVNLPLNCSSPYDAGTVSIGNSSTTRITCRANIPVSVTAIDLDATTHYAVSGLPTFPYTLNANDEFSFSANFSPKAVGPLSTNINVRTNNGGGNADYAINTPVVIRGVATSLSPILTIQPNVLSFGEVITGVDTSGKSLDFSLQNDGESPLVITNYRLSVNSSTGPFFTGNTAGPFTFLDLPPIGSSIAGNTAVTTSVNFNPTTNGYFRAYLVIDTNAGSKFVGAFGTAGGPPKALLEWQLENGTWIPFEDGKPFEFGPVILGTQEFRKMRLTNIGGTTLTTTISKPPVSGALAAVNALGSIAEGSQLSPNKSEEATLICSPPKSQVNKDPTLITAIWTLNNNDATFGKHEVNFTCAGTSVQVGPLDPQGQGYYRYMGCFKDANPNRNMDELLYYSETNTNGDCQTSCMNRPESFAFAATEYEGECWCGHRMAIEKVEDTRCQYLCKGNFTQYCGGDGAYLSLFADRRKVDINNPGVGNSTSSVAPTSTATSTSTETGTSTVTSTSSSVSATSTARPGYVYLGCANEGTNGRALTRDATASSTQTVESCEDYCTSKGYMLSGMEYGSECYCGNTLENGAAIGGSNACNMYCAGNSNQICGGVGALSVYNNTDYKPPQQPVVLPSVAEYISQGCYTEGVNERALNQTATASGEMTVVSCVNFCRSGGFRFAGLEYSTECYCGAGIASTAQQATSGCDMLCGGDKMTYCGGAGRLNIYAASVISSTSSNVATSTGTGNFTISSATITSITGNSTISSTTVISATGNSTISTTTGSSISSSVTATATPTSGPRPGYYYIGCFNEGTNGRALAKDATVNATLTLESCQDYCTLKGYPLSGMEYSTECYCGTTMENGATIGSANSCNMPCGGNSAQICGGPGALSVYNNTMIVPPRQPVTIPSVDNFISQGCYTEGVNERALGAAATAASNMTVATCVNFCNGNGYRFAGLEYSTECYCGNTIAATATTATSGCDMLCGGDKYSFCGGVGRLNIYSASVSTATTNSQTSTTTTVASGTSVITTATVTNSSSISITTTAGSTVSSAPTMRPGYTYLGCANEGSNGRALTRDATASSTLTIESCQDYCTSKGYPLSGMEYSTECYCGSALQNGATIGGSNSCNMPCGGNANQVCGGPGALSVYNNTALVPPQQPVTIPVVAEYLSQGCYTEGVNERALGGAATATANMTVTMCINFCRANGFRYAGLEYSTECYCGSSIANTAANTTSGCDMLCGGDKNSFCGGINRLNIYYAPFSSLSTTSMASTLTSISTTTSTISSTSISTSNSTTSSAPISATVSASVSTSISTTSSTSTSTSTGIATPTLRAGYTYLGCASEGINGRALTKDATASSTLTIESCQDYCSGKGYPLSGTEYSTECYCGSVLENNGTIGGSNACNMPCGGNSSQVCGGPGALSVYNNTALASPPQPSVIPRVDNYVSQGCYTEGLNERALNATATAAANMTVALCVNFCEAGGYRYAGVEYSTECYCGAGIASTAQANTTGCNMLCGGDKLSYCGGVSRLNIYAASDLMFAAANSSTSSIASTSLSSITSSSTRSSSSTTSSTSTLTSASTSSSSHTMSISSSSLVSSSTSTLASSISTSAITSSNTVSSTSTSSNSTPTSSTVTSSLYTTSSSVSNTGFSATTSTVTSSTTSRSTSSVAGSEPTSVNTTSLNSSITTLSTLATSTRTSTSTSSTTSATSTSAAPWQYLGCANETDHRSLSGAASAGSMTVEKCQNFCFDKDFPLAGVEYGNECYCGSALQNGSKLNQTGCTMPCTGDSSEICGGTNRLSVYNYTLFIPPIIVPSVGTYDALGCYAETTSKALTGYRFSNNTLTVEQCVTTCESRNFTFAGVEYGRECYCGNSISATATKVADTQCNMLCAGNKRTYCGAGNRIIIYQSLQT